ncbi:large-conductance mechanosensitive channel protein MscL [Ruminococcus champanellensis]|uniref:large-conductance mechanosensitive channel protein MscL n=1 Tax=Ruminococcus champanellensis TaxID=1161942 RepID=UPI0031BA844B
MAETNAPAPQTPAPQTPAPQTPQPAQKVKTASDSARSILKEFKDFISRGNVLDMAVGIIVGGAFTSIVSSLVDDLLMPLIGTLLVGINFKSLGVTIPWGNHPYLNFGSFIQQVIIFLLTAACVFTLVKTVNKITHKQKAAPKPTKDQELLTEIRDLLKAQAEK